MKSKQSSLDFNKLVISVSVSPAGIWDVGLKVVTEGILPGARGTRKQDG